MNFLNALASFFIVCAIAYGWIVISETFKLPRAMRFFAEPQAGSDLRKCIFVIGISALWLIFGD